MMKAVEAGVRWVQLRDHEASDDEFAAAARELADDLRRLSPGVVISINRRMSVAVELGAGFHTGAGGPSLASAADAIQNQPIGYSAHSIDEVRQARRKGVDYVIFSPIFRTTSKPSAEPAGLDVLEEACPAAGHVPVIALGGITPQNAPDCLQAGAHGIAVLSGILAADEVKRAVEAYAGAIAQPPDPKSKIQNPK